MPRHHAPPRRGLRRGVRLRHHRTAQERGMKAEWEANEDAARRREPTVGQEAVSPRSRMRRLVRSQWLTQRHGRLNTACCLSVEGVATTKQRLDRAVGPAAAPCAQIPPRPQRFFNELKSHPGIWPECGYVLLGGKSLTVTDGSMTDLEAKIEQLNLPHHLPVRQRREVRTRHQVRPECRCDGKSHVGQNCARSACAGRLLRGGTACA